MPGALVSQVAQVYELISSPPVKLWQPATAGATPCPPGVTAIAAVGETSRATPARAAPATVVPSFLRIRTSLFEGWIAAEEGADDSPADDGSSHAHPPPGLHAGIRISFTG